MPNANEVFADELKLIKSQEVRDFVLRVFDTMTPDYFWTCPASTSGKYHPQVSLGEGGLVRHTKLAVWWGVELMRMYDPSPEAYDAVIAALILHDLRKNGDRLVNGRPTLPNCVNVHGTLLAEEIGRQMFPPGIEPGSVYNMTLDGIAYHMGRWTDPNWKYQTMESEEWLLTWERRIVHMADYCASRKVDAKTEELMR